MSEPIADDLEPRPSLQPVPLPARPVVDPTPLRPLTGRRGRRGRDSVAAVAGDPASALPAACPHLGLPDDQATHFLFPHSAHRCFATRKAGPIEEAFQATHCLGAAHPTCPRYTAAVLPLPARAAATGVGRSWPVRQASPRRDLRAVSRDQRLLRIGVAVVAGLFGLLGLILVLDPGGTASSASQTPLGGAVAGSPSGTPTQPSASVLASSPFVAVVSPPPTRTPAPSVSPTATSGSVAATPTPMPTSTPTPTPVPTPTRTTTPASTATPVPTPAPTARPTRSPRVYIVQPGDTLSALAARFGTTVEAIVRLNNLADESYILAGQRLLIP